MIAVSSSGTSFRALAAYLAHGRTGLEEERIAWSSAHNLPTGDLEVAATLMRATAAQNVRVEKPVHHLVIAFDPGDPVDRATMERIADRVLARLGLEGHQVLIVAHRDREHPHLHILVNRVHPETGKGWDRWQDMAVIQQVLREEERALGLREVNGSQHEPVMVDRPVGVNDRTPDRGPEGAGLTTVREGAHAASGKTDAAVPRLVDRARSALPAVREAASWEAVGSVLREVGLRLERRRSGLVVTDGDRYARASSIGPDLTLRRLEARLGPHPTEQTTHARNADLPEADRNGAERLHAGDRASHRGPSPGARDLQIPMFAPRIEETWSREVAHVARQVAQLEQAQHVAAAHWEAVRSYSAARARVEQLDDAVARRDGASRSLGAVFIRVYREPDRARSVFEATVRDRGADAAAAQLRARPETYGNLIAEERSRAFGLARQLDDGAARRTAMEGASVALELAAAERVLGQALGAGSSTVRGTERDPGRTIAGERARRATALGQAAAREQALAGERRALPGAHVLERGIREGMHRLTPHEVRQLHAMLTRPQGALLTRVRHTMKEAVLGRESGE